MQTRAHIKWMCDPYVVSLPRTRALYRGSGNVGGHHSERASERRGGGVGGRGGTLLGMLSKGSKGTSALGLRRESERERGNVAWE